MFLIFYFNFYDIHSVNDFMLAPFSRCSLKPIIQFHIRILFFRWFILNNTQSEYVVKRVGPGATMPGFRILAPPLSSYVTIDKLITDSWFPYL